MMNVELSYHFSPNAVVSIRIQIRPGLVKNVIGFGGGFAVGIGQKRVE